MTTFLLILVAALLLLSAPAMANLTVASPRQYRGIDKRTTVTYPAAGALFAGAFVEEDGSGNMQNATAAGTTFAGIALMSATTAGDRIEVADKVEVRLSIAKGSAIALTDIGSTVYVGDGGTDINLTASSRQAIGKVTEVEPAAVGANTGFCWVYVEGQSKRSL
jgi:hypothetical protein